jgi:hypothetical protein
VKHSLGVFIPTNFLTVIAANLINYNLGVYQGLEDLQTVGKKIVPLDILFGD